MAPAAPMWGKHVTYVSISHDLWASSAALPSTYVDVPASDYMATSVIMPCCELEVPGRMLIRCYIR